MNKFDLLELLGESGGGYISGETIAEKFGVTRAAVWKAVAALKQMGYAIEAKTNNGYKLSGVFDLLNEYEIKSRLNKSGLADLGIIYKAITGSTNDDAKNSADSGRNMLFAGGELTGARGRYGRGFSAKEGGVYLTLKICRENNFFNMDGITFFPLIAAAATCHAVYDLCGVDLCIKWPNDLLYQDGAGYKKICGVLTEASFQAENRAISYVAVGIGLNANIDTFGGGLENIATSLQIIAGEKFSRADLLCAIVENFMRLADFERGVLLGEYKKRLVTGIGISFAQNGQEYRGIARGINENGNLIAELDENGGQLVTVQSSEINFV